MSSGEQEQRVVGRRSVLKAAAGVAAAGLVATPAVAGAEETGGWADVIVIGSGFAGVTAARDLRAAGLRPLVIEARGRVGGRTWTSSFEGQTIEFGGQWVGDVHTNAIAELNRYGIATKPGGPLPLRAFFPNASGAQQEVDFLTANDHLNSLLAQLFEGSADYFPQPRNPLYAQGVLANYEPLSLQDRLNQLTLSTQDRLWLGGMTGVFSGGTSTRGALTAFAQAWAGGGHTGQGWNELQEYLIEGGTGALLGAILADARPDLRLNSPVVSVTQEPGRVVVTTRSGARYRAPAVVVTAPVNVWHTIDFTPGLPAVHTAATTQGVGVPNAAKLLIRLAGGPRLPFALGAEGAPMSWIVPQTELANGDQLVVGFTVDPTINLASVADVQAKVRTILPGATVRGFRAHSWWRDPWAQGGWALRSPGQLLQQVPAIHQPQGRVVFASGDVPAAWHGYIEGAIEAGKIGAAQALSII
ncbi:FAD-dependent oxidoreductase [Saccharothrix violaceirubra]|uniref:Monoamine oxidase n=1 Tax=Saccharothrix violaceirubra TaxID=413306 RepID=A0A7W7T4B9_9PSEU|nr:NAD(P)/FAD-dependent oxidoreductase [Saccharothrix violaceirubra]MBB4966323.1 monoamine oxidase [Saccharothrix violaceirubra]